MTISATRSATLKQALLDHKQRQQGDVQSRVREGRAQGTREVGDMLDSSDADIQSGLDFALLQMRSATLSRIDEALARLNAGQYGTCSECGEDISERRLRALPFAVRCHECEAQREAELGQTTTLGQPRHRAELYSEGGRP